MSHPASRLPRLLALVYAGLVAYACLHPIWNWRDAGVAPLDFLTAPLPPYRTAADLFFNFLGFVPLGFLAATALRPLWKAGWVVLGVLVACTGFSLVLEVAQNYLPSRVSSNLDVLMNGAGALVGALAGARWFHLFDQRGGLHRWRVRRILPGLPGEIGLILLALWWLAQLYPGTMLFASGDLRSLLDPPASIAFSAPRFVVLEAAIVTTQLLAIGLIALRCMRAPVPGFVLFVLVMGLLVVSLATTLFVAPQEPLRWLSPGAGYGLVVGLSALLLVRLLPSRGQHALACLALLLGTVLVNIAPQNPFVLHISQVMLQSHAFNFLGLTEWVARLWPFVALMWLVGVGERRTM